MEIWTLGLPSAVALGLVALLGYSFGRRTRTILKDTRGRTDMTPAADPPDESEDAGEVLLELERTADQVRRALAAHHTTVLRFNDRVRSFCHQPNEMELQQLSAEAERMLQPTRKLTNQIVCAYDEFRQQAQRLRCEKAVAVR